jgi:hypothetical protein
MMPMSDGSAGMIVRACAPSSTPITCSMPVSSSFGSNQV